MLRRLFLVLFFFPRRNRLLGLARFDVLSKPSHHPLRDRLRLRLLRFLRLLRLLRRRHERRVAFVDANRARVRLRAVPYKRTSGWSSKASDGVERRRGRGLKPWGGRRETPAKVLKDRRSPRRRGRMGPVYRTHLKRPARIRRVPRIVPPRRRDELVPDPPSALRGDGQRLVRGRVRRAQG